MCGLTGVWYARHPRRALEPLVEGMAETLTHRGPDDGGTWCDDQASFAVGHRRLSIIDLSREGRQPMVSACGRWVLAYNGEIYNHKDLRNGLGDATFRGHSDTEILLESIARHGLHDTLDRCVGMFAFALWDRSRRELSLVRDRIGIKPLYYGFTSAGLVFGSELRAFHAVHEFEARIDRGALDLFLRHACVPQPHAIYENVHKVHPGEIIRFRRPDNSAMTSKTFWNAFDKWRECREAPFPGNEAEATDQLEALLQDAVDKRMIADVPVGAFLSGGIDSSVVVALMRRTSSFPVRTFSIGSEDPRYDEAHDSRAIANHLGTDHTELVLTGEDALATAFELPRLMDEPLGDSSMIPTLAVARLARRDVTVALSGDGGDELFGGYSHYSIVPARWQRSRRIPSVIRAIARTASHAINRHTAALPSMLDYQLQRVAFVTSMVGSHSDDPLDTYWHIFRYWNDVDDLVPSANAKHVRVEQDLSRSNGTDVRERMMLADLSLYLPDVLLTKLDRCTMGVSLEGRVPLLDHRVVEFAWRLPTHWKVRGGATKWVLRQVLQRHVPRRLFERPKRGFSVPLHTWLRNELRPWAEELLDPQRLNSEGFLNVDIVRRRWHQHLDGHLDWRNELWNVLMFQRWLEEERERRKALRTQVLRDC